MAPSGLLAQTFVLVFLFKYLRLFVNLVALFFYQPIHPRSPAQSEKGQKSRLTADDVSVIIPVLDPGCSSLQRFVPTCLALRPKSVYIVTVATQVETARALYQHLSPTIHIRSITKANKRNQLMAVLPEITTEIVILADDDVIWPLGLFDWILAPFDLDAKIGGLQTRQRTVRPDEAKGNAWDFLNSQYLVRRNFDCTACVQMDYGLPCLSGRTVAYRSHIIQTRECLEGFTTETWSGRLLNTDDDNYLTRWLVSHGWKTWIQNHPDCEVLTTLENNAKYYHQCVRWSRSNWRSNLRSMFTEATVWTRHPWSTYAVFQTTITSWAPVYDLAVNWLFWNLTAEMENQYVQKTVRVAMILWTVWICRAVKYVDHWRRYPQDIKYVVALPLIGYVHTVAVKLWAMVTLNETTWGSRDGADDYEDGSATTADRAENKGPAGEGKPPGLTDPASQLDDDDGIAGLNRAPRGHLRLIVDSIFSPIRTVRTVLETAAASAATATGNDAGGGQEGAAGPAVRRRRVWPWFRSSGLPGMSPAKSVRVELSLGDVHVAGG